MHDKQIPPIQSKGWTILWQHYVVSDIPKKNENHTPPKENEADSDMNF